MELLTIGFPTAFSLENLFYCFLGVFLGTFVGVIPGIGALAAVTLLLPLTFYIDPLPAIIMLAGVYYGAEYGGSTSSILLNLPGTASNAITCLDGYPMTKQGRAGVALFTTTIASFVGGSLGIIILMTLIPAVVALTLSFGPAEYFGAMLLGLIAAATIGRGSPIKGIAMVLLGLMLGTVGADVGSGSVRYTLGMMELYDGIALVTLAMGLFGVSEIIGSIRNARHSGFSGRISMRSLLPSWAEFRLTVFPMLRGTAVGSFFGPLPGAGPSIAAALSYSIEKRVSKNRHKLGTGAIEGISSPEAANNAAVQTAFVPTLALGIPGTATMAIILGALMIHGINPGPRLISQNPELFWGLVASFWIGNVMLLVLNIPLIGMWVKLLQVPYRFLYPAVICLICVGVYSLNASVFGIYVLLALGVLGYFMRLWGFDPAPVLIGFILGPMIEENFRRAMLLARGDFFALLDRPIAAVLIVTSVLLATVLILQSVRARFRQRRGGEAAQP